MKIEALLPTHIPLNMGPYWGEKERKLIWINSRLKVLGFLGNQKRLFKSQVKSYFVYYQISSFQWSKMQPVPQDNIKARQIQALLKLGCAFVSVVLSCYPEEDVRIFDH